MITYDFKLKFRLDGPNKPNRKYGNIDKHYDINIPENKLLFNHNINKEKEQLLIFKIIKVYY